MKQPTFRWESKDGMKKVRFHFLSEAKQWQRKHGGEIWKLILIEKENNV